jgi:uncharacterized protein with HEPN domain
LPFRDAYTHFADIQESIENIYGFLGDIDFAAYEKDRKTKSAVERQLQIITEAAIRLGDDGEKLAPGPDWRSFRGMGNILRHGYHRVDDKIVWDTVKIDLPDLKDAITRALMAKPTDNLPAV